MGRDLFRKKSAESISSPEQLNEYIRVVSPSVWLVLSAVILLLAGALVWGVFGKLETTIPAAAVCENGHTTCFISAESDTIPKPGMEVILGEKRGDILSVNSTPVRFDKSTESYVFYKSGFREGDFCYLSNVEIDGLADGTYSAKIVVGNTSPISFILR